MEKWFTFNAHGGDSELNGRSGEVIVVVGKLHPSEHDECETGPMHRIRFDDGFETDAFIDEIEINYGL